MGYVVPDGQALTKALEIAEMINNNGPLAVQAILQSIRETEEVPERGIQDRYPTRDRGLLPSKERQGRPAHIR